MAARLEKVAAPGEVLCGRLTAELAGSGVWFRERQPVLLKGKQEPVGVWEAVALRTGGRRADGRRAPAGGPRRRAGVPGRPVAPGATRRPAPCRSAVRRRRFGQDPAAERTGPAGGGGGTVIRATYPAYGAMGGSRVAAEVIRQLGPAHDREVSARLRSIAGDLDPSLQAIDPAGIPKEQLWALARLMQEKGAAGPLLLIIDDMHHSGDRTLDLLGELAGRLNNVPLLTVLAGRTEPGEWLSRFPAATTVRLGPLSRADAVTLAAGLRLRQTAGPRGRGFPGRPGQRQPSVPAGAGGHGPGPRLTGRRR